jgi:hypothetical protein
MMFQGSKNASKDYFVYAEKAGANLAEGGVRTVSDEHASSGRVGEVVILDAEGRPVSR